MNAARELTSAISMLRAPTPKVDITVLATRDLLEMDLTASLYAMQRVRMEVFAWPPECVNVVVDLRAKPVSSMLMNVHLDSTAATQIPAV